VHDGHSGGLFLASAGAVSFFKGAAISGGETEAHMEQAFRLSPRDTFVYVWSMFVGLAKLWQGADAEAIVWLRRSLEANRNYPLRISIWRLLWRSSVSWMRHGPQRRRALR
jgi:hypothetical protein